MKLNFKETKMRKEDLKTGMILEFKDGTRGLMLDDEIFFIRKDGANFSGSRSRSCMNKNLEIDEDKRVNKVFVPNTPKHTNIGYGLSSFIFDKQYKTLVWERQVTEMTLEQVCAALGKDIKIVKGN